MSRLRRLSIPMCAAFGLMVAAAPAFGQQGEIVIVTKKVPPGYEPVRTTVKIADLDLATSMGVGQMQKRVGEAIAALCPIPAAARPRYEAQDSKLCRNSAWESAKPQMDQAVLRATRR